MTRDELPKLIEESLKRLGGAAPLVEVAKDIWKHHEAQLIASGDLFYTWQYDMRWAAQRLRDAHKLAYAKKDRQQVWQLI
jgi:hypothetical protein